MAEILIHRGDVAHVSALNLPALTDGLRAQVVIADPWLTPHIQTHPQILLQFCLISHKFVEFHVDKTE
jgi:hypothetical protein